jgi:hypothetical protein
MLDYQSGAVTYWPTPARLTGEWAATGVARPDRRILSVDCFISTYPSGGDGGGDDYDGEDGR